MEEVAEQKEQAMANYKHMDLEDRIGIQTGLKEGKNFKEIGEAIGRDASTVAKEVKGHLIVKETGTKSRPYNPCKNAGHAGTNWMCARNVSIIHGDTGAACVRCVHRSVSSTVQNLKKRSASS